MQHSIVVSFLVALWLLSAPSPADAYIGPGAGISVIGTAVAFIGAVVFALVGFVWYPIKRLRAALRNPKRDAGVDQGAPVP